MRYAHHGETVNRLLAIPEVAAQLGCGRTLVYALLRSGELRAIKLGRLTRISSHELDRFIATMGAKL
jgi:excisionase family DNA binding protein